MRVAKCSYDPVDQSVECGFASPCSDSGDNFEVGWNDMATQWAHSVSGFQHAHCTCIV